MQSLQRIYQKLRERNLQRFLPLFAIAIALPLLVILSFKQQEIRQHAAVVTDCNDGLVCTGCTATGTNSCSYGNGTQSCTYKTALNGSACNAKTVSSVLCHVNNCLAGYTCNSSQQCIGAPVPTPTVKVSSTNPSGQAMPTGDIAGWKMIFSDDFNTNVGEGGFLGAYPKWGAYPTSFHDTSGHGIYDPGIISVANSVLTMRINTSNGVHRVAAPEANGGKNQLYGRYTVRFKADSLKGYKTAWLLWPQSGNWPHDGEIDFPEGNLNGNISAFMHKQDATSGSDQDAYSTSVNYSSWHTATTEWGQNKLVFILDGKVIGTSTSRVPNTPMHWVIQTETALDGTTPADNVTGNVQLDWVAMYTPN